MIVSILLAISLALIALVTAVGNLVVLLAFVCEKKLRTINGNSMELKKIELVSLSQTISF